MFLFLFLEQRVMSGWQRWDPLGDFQREFGRLLQTLEPSRGWRLPRPFPALNLYDAGDRYILTAELPGMAPEEIEVALTGEVLELRGERRRPEGIGEECYRRQERPHGRWSRSITLPERIEGAAVSAQCDHGILTVILPKAGDQKPRSITVTASPPSSEAQP